MAKSILITYVLWMFGGGLGLHHLYLKRDRHAFIWWSTLGGVFFIGWLRDLCRIPDYVAEANEDKDFMTELKHNMKTKAKPKFSSVRFAGELVMGCIFGYLLFSAVPEEYTDEKAPGRYYLMLLLPIAVALGVHLVANVGYETGKFLWCLIGAYVVIPWLIASTGAITYSAITSSIAVNWKGKGWRKEKSKRGFCKRFMTLSFCGMIYLSLWASTFYHNAYITTKEGDNVRFKDAVHNFLKSPAWAETKETFWQLYQFYQLHGFQKLWEEFVTALDPQGEANAWKVLNLNSSASQQEVKTVCRKLSREWHPDKHKDPKQKQIAQEKFMEIQAACDTLSSIRSNRARRNEKKRDEL